jgi:hypothetical protein
MFFFVIQTFHQFFDSIRLITGGCIRGYEAEGLLLWHKGLVLSRRNKSEQYSGSNGPVHSLGPAYGYILLYFYIVA